MVLTVGCCSILFANIVHDRNNTLNLISVIVLPVSSDGDCHGTKPLLDLRQVTVLPREEYLKIKESLNHQSNHKKRIEEAAKQREAMHQQSKEVVKLWSNTIVVS